MRHHALVAASLVLVTAACHPPSLRSRAKALGANVVHMGKQVVAIAGPSIHVDANVKAVAMGRVEDVVRSRAGAALAAQQPIVLNKSVVRHDDGGDDVAPDPAPAPAARRDEPPTVIVHHVDAARPTVFALHGTTFGGKQVCEAFTSMDECTSSCTSRLRVNAWNPNAKSDPAGTQSCSCLEQDGGC